MNNNEIKDFIKDNKENNYQLEVSATLTTIISILIKNKITTREEFKKIQKFCLEKVRDEQIERMTSEEKEQLETIKKFNDLFGVLL